ncbi:hypothetical protein [Clostridium tyrobutyricum]|uniref:hypothetical protein n=1 Tax=Clostridium tyrobutyricum TaxID=1519 RepID=UPI001C38E202|nr:hypothetical protein [Clostridium tyrobutyricum]MBV4426582.1 hypothetical protein [Clostridium tyrobutyricum]
MRRSLNLNKLKDRPRTTVASQEALREVVPFKWSKEVLEGKKRITVSKKATIEK